LKTANVIKLNDVNLKKLAENLQILLTENNVTETQIAQSLNVPVMTIRRIVSGETSDPRISTLNLIASYFNVSIDALIQNNSIKTLARMQKNIPKFVPIFDWSTVTNAASISAIDISAWNDWYPIILGCDLSLGPDAFAIESRPSMQPRFPIGTIFIIDPNEQPRDGDIAIIKMKSNNELSLREVIIDSPRWQLLPIITGSDMLFYDNNQHHIIGIVVLTLFQSRKTSRK